MRFLPCGSDGLLIELADLNETIALDAALRAARPAGLATQIPAARTILVTFDRARTNADSLAAAIAGLHIGAASRSAGKTVEIPVLYDGPDLAEVADLTGFPVGEVIRRQGATPWTVAFNGFAPGFSYLVGGDPALDVPRRKSPRTAIPAGSVALAGLFSGVYPKASPGGWQLLGRTSSLMWDETRDPPALLQPGDQVRFVAVAALEEPVSQPAAAPALPSGDHFAVEAAPLPALFQDHGRFGVEEQGVAVSGTLDRAALRQLNRLLGNPPDTAAIELTGGGFAFRSTAPAVIAVTGAPCTLKVNDALRFASHAPVPLDAGDKVIIGAPVSGLRSLLGVRGGFDAPLVLGSASTDTLSTIGPAPITAGHRIGLKNAKAAPVLPPEPAPLLPYPGDVVDIDVVFGPRADWFVAESLARFAAQDWTVSAQSSRVGIRLEGEPLTRLDTGELPSEGTPAGAIQVPHSGLPVVFLADHPMTGGYPVIAVVAAHHLDRLGQIPPGARMRFRPLAPFSEIRPLADGLQP